MELWLPTASPIQVELTSKRFKRQQLIGLAIFAAGLVLCAMFMVLAETTIQPSAAIRALLLLSFFIAVGGLVYCSVARGRAWWHHG